MWRRLIYHPDINYALRQTLVLCLPVAVGLMLGELRFGLLFSLVPACCNIAGLDTPHKRFFKRLIIGASLFATCSLLTQVLLAKDVPLPFLLTGLTLVLGVTAELGPLHAKLLPASLLAAIFTLSLAGYMPVWEPLLIYALGTLWYGLFNWFWFWIWREQPLRESLSLLYRELADYCEAKYSLLTQHTDPEKALPPLLVRQQKAAAAAGAPAKSGRSNYPVLSANAYAISKCICFPRKIIPITSGCYRLQADAAYFPGGAGFAGTYFGQFASAGRGAKAGRA